MLFEGAATTRGVRYILAGFCDYGAVDYSADISSDAAHNHFMSTYDPLYDGTAASVGFRSGDLIVGIEVCDDRTAESCQNPGPDTGGEQCNAELRGDSPPPFRRRRVNITGLTTDEEWMQHAQSCERLDTQGETVLWVRRRKQKRTKRGKTNPDGQ